MSARACIEIAKEDIHFAAAHFTVFSATKRENLHGHNFFVTASLGGDIDDSGLCFDYNIVKTTLRKLCDSLDETVLLPANSPHLKIEQSADCVDVRFADERMQFLPRDVKLLAVRNVTVEELANWFADELSATEAFMALPIDRFEIRVSSGPGQWAAVTRDGPAKNLGWVRRLMPGT